MSTVCRFDVASSEATYGSASNDGSSRAAVEIDVDGESTSVGPHVSGTAVLVTVALEVVDAIDAVRLRVGGSAPAGLDLRL